MGLVSLPCVRRAQHVDVGYVGIMRLDIALQLADKRAMRLSWVGERLRCMCSRHTTNYAELCAPRHRDGAVKPVACFHSMKAPQRKTAPQELQRLNKFQCTDTYGIAESVLGQEVPLDAASGHQHDQANRDPAQRRPRCSFLPGRRCRARAAPEVIADAKCCYYYTDNRGRRHEDERPLPRSQAGHRPATPRPTSRRDAAAY